MMRSIPESTALLDRYLQSLRVPVARLLNPGVAPETVKERLAPHGLKVGAELAALYSWHNGTEVSPQAALNDSHLIPGFYFTSLDESLAIYERFVNEFHENPFWFPIMADGASGYSFVDCSKEEQQPVHHFTFEDEQHEIEFSSIRDMLGTIADAYERGIFFVGQDGWLDMDWDAYWDLAGEMNPGASYWRDTDA